MFTFEGRCPYCSSDRGFVAFGMGISEIRENTATFALSGTCLSCHEPIVAICETASGFRNKLHSCIHTYEERTLEKVDIKRIIPEPITHYAPISIPSLIRVAFIDVQEMLKKNISPHFIITGCRTVLEAAVKELGGEGDTLKQRIANLFEKGVITKVLADWADHVRLAGNEAVHEMGGTREEARELVEFSKVFLQFTFELPATIQAARNK